MNVTSCFNFLANCECFMLDRREIFSNLFGDLRKQIRVILEAMYEGGNDHEIEIAHELRNSLSEWLTVPVPFDGVLINALQLLGNRDIIERRWGDEVVRAFEAAVSIAESMQQNGNPMRRTLGDEIEKLLRENTSIRIYAHPKSVEYFISLCNTLTEEHFLYGYDVYSASKSFDVLLKVGPLRSVGWGKCPDALLTSPRFRILTQFVWSGSSDEEHFGLDPVTGASVVDVLANKTGMALNGVPDALKWSLKNTRIGDTVNDPENGIKDEPDEDDFSFLLRIKSRYADVNRERSAALIKFVNAYGILIPSREEVLVYDPEKNEEDGAIELVLPTGKHLEGCFFVLPMIEIADFGEVHVEKIKYSKIWKGCLADVIKSHPEDLSELSRLLRMNKVGLQNLKGRLPEWCNPPSTVIPAPRKWEHFNALIAVLGEHYNKHELLADDFAKKAWVEIRRSRGNAINEGREESRTQKELEFDLLIKLMSEIVNTNTGRDEFIVPVAPDHDLQGSYRFFLVESVEQGLVVPDTVLREIHSVTEFDIWRG
ncbi:MAG: hypothetical protein ISR54_06160 [Chlorobium phaeobacteroides]|uniref:Uncharacterized protein n=1 Tax=Chlorobium phaeobacteroides (strain BS1) TaxID=331678 RepID=B3EJE5_CHLPB|nr:hypothetical protein [Chlorobium phaeobacteroides]